MQRNTLHSSLLAAGTLALLLAAPGAHAQTLIFDNISSYENGATGSNASTTSSTPNTFMGDGYTLLSGTKDITGFDIYPTNVTGTNYTGLKATIYVWGTVNTGAVSASTPAFSNLLGSYTITSTGTYTTGFFYPFESAKPGVTPGISLTTPLALSSPTIGLTFAFQGTTDGATYAPANNLTSLITYGVPPTVGSQVFNGYYRNANSETNGNFTSTLRSLGVTNQSLAVRVYGDVVAAPEPSQYVAFAIGILGIGALSLCARRRPQAA